MVLPRRMLRRNVERGEVVEVGLDVRTLGDREAHVGEDLGNLVGDLADGVDAPIGERSLAHGERDVGALRGEPRLKRGAGQRLLLRLQRLGDAILELVDGLAEILARLRRQLPEPLHQLGDAALAPERGNPDLFQL